MDDDRFTYTERPKSLETCQYREKHVGPGAIGLEHERELQERVADPLHRRAARAILVEERGW